MNRIEKSIYALISLLTLTGILIAFFSPDSFKHQFVVEDGFIEWLTVITLLIAFVVCVYRVITLWSKKRWLFLTMTALLALVLLFVAGEEISWGQRILNIDSSEFFLENNAQRETNLHNMRVNGVKINKIIFTYGLGVILLTYWLLLTPLYHKNDIAQRWLDNLAAPIPHKHQIIAYFILVFAIQALVLSSKRGELLECCGVLLFLVNILYPYNQENFK